MLMILKKEPSSIPTTQEKGQNYNHDHGVEGCGKRSSGLGEEEEERK